MCSQTPTHSDIVDLENYIDAIDDSHRIKRQAAVELLQSQQALFSEDLEGIQNDLDGYVKAIERMRQDIDNLSRQARELAIECQEHERLFRANADSTADRLNKLDRQILVCLDGIGASYGDYR